MKLNKKKEKKIFGGELEPLHMGAIFSGVFLCFAVLFWCCMPILDNILHSLGIELD